MLKSNPTIWQVADGNVFRCGFRGSRLYLNDLPTFPRECSQPRSSPPDPSEHLLCNSTVASQPTVFHVPFEYFIGVCILLC